MLLGNGNGTFQAQTTFATGDFPAGVVVADFSDSGRADIAVANEAGSSVSVFLAGAGGGFAGPTYNVNRHSRSAPPSPACYPPPCSPAER